jgi:hypothetical protein
MVMSCAQGLQERTSAAAAAAAFGSSSRLLSPSVRGGPPTFGFGGATLFGTDALVAGAGADPRVRPWPSKLSFDCLAQRLPICSFEEEVEVVGCWNKRNSTTRVVVVVSVPVAVRR